MSDGYLKLFGSDLLQSSVWQEELWVKVVWVTLMALANENGTAKASVPGLAKTAGVTISQCEDALAKFLAPDKYSRTREHEGRRIEVVDGGWRLLNHAKYRARMGVEERREKARLRMQRLRDERAPVRTPANACERGANTGEPNDLSPHCVRDVRDPDPDPDPESLSGKASPVFSEDPDSARPEPPDSEAIDRADREQAPPAAEPPPDLALELTDTWHPEAEPEIEAEAERLGADLVAELVKFRERARQRGTISVDWQAMWRGWIRRAIEWARKHRPTKINGDHAYDAKSAAAIGARNHEAADRHREADRVREAAAAADREEVARLAAAALKALSTYQPTKAGE